MPIYLVTELDGAQSRIAADADFVEAEYPGRHELVEADAAATIATRTRQITRRQGLLAVFRSRQITEEMILAAVGQLPDEALRYEAVVEFHSAYWEIDNPLIAMLAAALEVGDGELQELFDYAGTL